MNILGISAFYHDSAACLVQDGKIVAAAQEERFTRKKHDPSFPTNAIQFCFQHQKISSEQLDFVAFYEKPFLKFERILESYLASAPAGIRSFIKAIPLWLKRKIWIKDLITRELDYSGEILFPEHHFAHAASAFFPSPFPEAAFLTIDGVGEWTTTSYGVGKNSQLSIWADIHFPHSIGLLYSAFTYYTGFKVNSGEYKVMGLAPYGEPKYKNLILNELIDLKPDGSFRLNLEYFDYVAGLTMTNARFHRLFGGLPRKPESPLTQREMDLARSIQDVIDDVILKMSQNIRQQTGQRYLCLAGGVALNCVANGKLLRSGIFDDLWIQPAAGDAGGAVGAALGVWYQFLKNERIPADEDFMNGSFLGPEYSDLEIRTFLQEQQIPFRELPPEQFPETVADLIAAEKVVGWFQGRMEFGPRALGARSILGDARSSNMQEIMNLKIKFRESFRPFAPAVPEEKVAEYFELDRPSPYMLLVADVKSDRRKPLSAEEQNRIGLEKLKIVRSDLPAITHVDYSARIQTVDSGTNPLFHALLVQFEKKYGCAVVINTSFNVRGEPIVCSPEDAYRCFMRTRMDYLVLGRFLIDKNALPAVETDPRWQNEFILD